jgi:hypothetical protein
MTANRDAGGVRHRKRYLTPRAARDGVRASLSTVVVRWIQEVGAALRQWWGRRRQRRQTAESQEPSAAAGCLDACCLAGCVLDLFTVTVLVSGAVIAIQHVRAA